MATTPYDAALTASPKGHALWVRLAHWVMAASVVTLIYSGVAILFAHPRLYWGQTGNSVTATIIELPLGPNYHNVHLGPATAFFGPNGPVSRPRTVEVYNLNGWARSLHFIVAWTLSFSLLVYLGAALLTGHFQRTLAPSPLERSWAMLGADLKAHLRFPPPQARGGPPYNLLQKLAYLGVVLIALPIMVITGLSMSPAVTAAYPVLMDLTGGYQSARLIHFIMMGGIVGFLLIHLAMTALTGLWRQLRAMTIG